MSGFFDFLAKIFRPEDKKDTSVVINVTGGNHQNTNRLNTYPSPQGPRHESSYQVKNPSPSASQIEVQSINLYSTGSRGKVFTNIFYKKINHNFGIEVVLVNRTSHTQLVNLGHCIYDEAGNTIIKGNLHPQIKPFSTLKQDIYIKPEAFLKLRNGKYRSQFWINDKRVQRVFFTIKDK